MKSMLALPRSSQAHCHVSRNRKPKALGKPPFSTAWLLPKACFAAPGVATAGLLHTTETFSRTHNNRAVPSQGSNVRCWLTAEAPWRAGSDPIPRWSCEHAHIPNGERPGPISSQSHGSDERSVVPSWSDYIRVRMDCKT